MIISRRRWSIACAVLASLVFPAAVPGSAMAHSIIKESHPVAQGSVPPGVVAISLRYNNRIDPARSRLTLTRPDRTQDILSLQPTSSADELAAAVVLTPGVYVLRWQVLSIDGHIVRGDVPFTVKAP